VESPLPSLQPTAASSMEPEEDMYVMLAQKERDLLLAAEIGQALLEKNEELSRQNEKIAEDFSKKLEVS
jgi:coiled-coil domain-containing protein 64